MRELIVGLFVALLLAGCAKDLPAIKADVGKGVEVAKAACVVVRDLPDGTDKDKVLKVCRYVESVPVEILATLESEPSK